MKLKTWHTLTIGDYQRIFEIRRAYHKPGQRHMTATDADAEIVSILTSVPIEQVDRLKLSEFNKALAQATEIMGQIPEYNPPRTMNLPGFGLVGIEYMVSNIDAGQYNEIMNFTRGEDSIIFNLDKIMATLCYPIKKTWWGGHRRMPRDTKNHGAVSEAWKEVPFLAAYSAAVFFYLIFKAFWGTTHNYLSRQLPRKMTPEMTAEVKRIMMAHSSQISDGFMPPVKWPRLKISLWNRFGAYLLCNTLTDFNTLRQKAYGKKNNPKTPLNQPLEDNASGI